MKTKFPHLIKLTNDVKFYYEGKGPIDKAIKLNKELGNDLLEVKGNELTISHTEHELVDGDFAWQCEVCEDYLHREKVVVERHEIECDKLKKKERL